MEKIFRPRLVILFIVFGAAIFLTNVWIKKEIDDSITPTQKIFEQDSQTVAVKQETEKSQPQKFSTIKNEMPPVKKSKIKPMMNENEKKSGNQTVIHEPMTNDVLLIQ